ncbi:MAG: hypothetical protein Q4A67_03845 [Aerococcus sp.]|nr:hypothetical protein [Aerococcus sp.]
MLPLENVNPILSYIAQLSRLLAERTDRSLGVQQCLQSLATSQARIEQQKQTPTLEATALYQSLHSIALFEKVAFTKAEQAVLEEIKAFANREGGKGEFKKLSLTNSWRRPF